MRQLLVGDTAPGQTQHRQHCMLLEQGYCMHCEPRCTVSTLHPVPLCRGWGCSPVWPPSRNRRCCVRRGSAEAGATEGWQGAKVRTA